MNVLFRVLWVLLILLSVAAGIPKLLAMEHERPLFEGLGLGTAALIGFGIFQTLGGVLLIPKQTRLIGAGMATVALVASAIMILLQPEPQIAFGVVSLLVSLIGVVVFRQSLKTK